MTLLLYWLCKWGSKERSYSLKNIMIPETNSSLIIAIFRLFSSYVSFLWEAFLKISPDQPNLSFLSIVRPNSLSESFENSGEGVRGGWGRKAIILDWLGRCTHLIDRPVHRPSQSARLRHLINFIPSPFW